MNLCTTDRIDPNAGDYLLLVDYGVEGLRVAGQFPTVGEALATALLGETYGNPCSILKMVRVDLTELNP